LREQRCDNFIIESLEKQSHVKRLRLSIDVKQSLIARIAKLENLKDIVRERFMQMDVGYSAGLRSAKLTAFEILIGAVINSGHIELPITEPITEIYSIFCCCICNLDTRQFLEDAGEIVLERVRDIV